MNTNFLRLPLASMTAAALIAIAPSAAQALQVSVDVAGIDNRGALGAAGNNVLLVDVGAGARVVGLRYDLTLTALAPSWLSEGGLYIDRTAQDAGFLLQPGQGVDDRPGTASYSGTLDLTALGLAFDVGGDGRLRIEFYDSYFDGIGSADSRWDAGSLTFDVTPVPEPAMAWLLLGGLAALGANRGQRTAGAWLRRRPMTCSSAKATTTAA